MRPQEAPAPHHLVPQQLLADAAAGRPPEQLAEAGQGVGLQAEGVVEEPDVLALQLPALREHRRAVVGAAQLPHAKWNLSKSRKHNSTIKYIAINLQVNKFQRPH